MEFLARVLIFSIIVAFSFNNVGESKKTFNVVDFGAVGDGRTDDSRAFLNAWKAFCGDENTPTLEIPTGKTFLLKSVRFEGPCKSQSVQVQILGNIIAPESIQAWEDDNPSCWLGFDKVSGLIIHGSGTIDGRGSFWWKERQSRPRAMHFNGCDNFDLSGFTIRDSPRAHISINSCNGGSISNIHINSPEESPNTDGIDISKSTDIHIRDSWIGSGDDCIAINGGSFRINITGIACGPGHGISVGSLGDGEGEDDVEDVHVRNCTLKGTQNGVRIKTMPKGLGYARKISFEEITLIECQNPIIINQQYHGVHRSRKFLNDNLVPESVEVSGVTFNSVNGTSVSEQAITLDCSKSSGCYNIVMNNVQIVSSRPGKKTRAFCNNVHGTSSYITPDVPCLSKTYAS